MLLPASTKKNKPDSEEPTAQISTSELAKTEQPETGRQHDRVDYEQRTGEDAERTEIVDSSE